MSAKNYTEYLTRICTIIIEMNIIVNGESKSVSERLTALQLLKQLGVAEKKLALEINEEIIPRSTLNQHVIHEGDKVEIIHAIGGG